MRWIVRIAVALVACVGVVIGLLFMLPTERIGQLASDQLERQTGRTLSLTGAFRPSLYPNLGVKTGRITISNAPWAQQPEMVTAEGAAVGVNLAALLRGSLQIETLELIEPAVHLERAADGRVNWALTPGTGSSAAAQADTDTAGATETPTLELGRLRNGRIHYRDHATGESRDLRNLTGTVALPKGSTTARVDLSAQLNGQAIAADAMLADWTAALNGKPTKLTGKFTFDTASLSIDGTVSLPGTLPAITAMIEARLADPAALAATLGTALPKEAAALKDASLAGQLQMSDAGLFYDGKIGGDFAGTPLSGNLSLSSDADFASRPRFEIATSVALQSVAKLGFDGVLSNTGTLVDGALDLQADNLPKLLSLAGVTLDMPAGTGRTMALKGPVTLSQAGVLRFPGVTAALDRNRVAGDVAVTTGAQPHIEATLSADKLDLSAYTADGQGGTGSANGGATEVGWSRDPIALSGLDAVNADITLKAKGVDLGVTRLGLTHLAARLRDGLLTMRLIDVRAYQGAMSGTVTLRGGQSVAFTSDIRAKDVQLEPMLGELLDIDRLRGSGTTNLKLSGQGRSLDGIMNSLSGSGDIEFGQGSIRGIDLAAMMRNLKSAFGGFEGATEFTSLTGSFSMAEGVLQNVDLSLLSPLFRAGGKGSVDLGGQSMNYVVTPTRLAKDAEFSVPVIITGPWRDLKFRPDLDKLLNLLLDQKLQDSEELQKAKKKLEEAKKKLENPEEAIKKKIKKKLAEDNGGVEKTLEEEVKDKLEDELGNALKKLFD